MILDEEIKSFLMDNAEDMQKVLIQEIRDKFIEKVDDKIVWKQGFRVRMQEIKEVKQQNIIKLIESIKYNARFIEKSSDEPFRLLQIPEEILDKLVDFAILGDKE